VPQLTIILCAGGAQGARRWRCTGVTAHAIDDSFIHSFIHPFVRLFVRSLIVYFVQLFVHSLFTYCLFIGAAALAHT
jgi:hypothetical protein